MSAEKLMFRVKLQVDPKVLQQFYRRVKTGVRGMGVVRTNARRQRGRTTSSQASAMTEAIVARLDSVSHRYGATIALDDVSIDIPARMMVGVIGPDGVGKSTMLALISGVRKIQEGQVFVFDGDMADTAHLNRNPWPHRLHAARSWPQSLSDAQRFREHRFLRPAVRAIGDRTPARITELLTATGARSVRGPSGRQAIRRNEAEAQSLLRAHQRSGPAHSRRADDRRRPALAAVSSGTLINSIRARRPQMSVMVATAYMDEAQRFDWLMAMDDGKIIANGTLKELLEKTGEPTLDEAFIALLPEAKRALHQKVIVRPRVASATKYRR